MHARDVLPWRSFIIETSWPADVAAIELRKRIGDGGFFVFARRGGDAPFVGNQSAEATFRFSRAIRYRNSFLPVIVAMVEPCPPGGARIHVTMRLHLFVIAFVCVWMSGAVFGGLAFGLSALAHGDLAGLLGLAFPLIGAALTTIPFALEARIAERLLRDVYANAPPKVIEPYR